MLNRYVGPGLLQVPTIGSRDSDAGRDRDVVIADGVGVAGGIAAGAVPVSMHPAAKILQMQRTIRQAGPIFQIVDPWGDIIPGLILISLELCYLPGIEYFPDITSRLHQSSRSFLLPSGRVY